MLLCITKSDRKSLLLLEENIFLSTEWPELVYLRGNLVEFEKVSKHRL